MSASPLRPADALTPIAHADPVARWPSLDSSRPAMQRSCALSLAWIVLALGMLVLTFRNGPAKQLFFFQAHG